MISLNRISKRYGKHKVLEDVTMDIYKGDIFGLIGKNGAGKTTMFKVILGLSEFEQGSLRSAMREIPWKKDGKRSDF